MSEEQGRSPWIPRIGWTIVLLGFLAFIIGLARRTDLDAPPDIRMLFVPSVEQGTIVERSNEMAMFLYEDTGLTVRTEVPTSYAAVIQAIGSGHADIAWMPAFAYVIANARHDAQARLQVVRGVDRYGIVVVRSGDGEPMLPADLAGRGVAIPETISSALRKRISGWLDGNAPGWRPVPADGDTDAVRRLLDDAGEVDAAVSSWVFSGENDLVGDGRKLLEYERPGSFERTRVLYTTKTPDPEQAQVYFGCVFTRSDSGIRRLTDLNGKKYAFSDETSTSGHIFPRRLLDREGIKFGREFMAGSHPNAVQAVWDGKADGGSAFYSPPGRKQAEDGTWVGDARALLMRRMEKGDPRLEFLAEVRILKLTDPIPNDVCIVRKGFPEEKWRQFEASLGRFLRTEEGRQAYFDLVAGVGVAGVDDSAFDGFREALKTSGVKLDALLKTAEDKLRRKREAKQKKEAQ